MSGTGDWYPGAMEDQVGLVGVRVGAWNHFEYPESVPAAGEHSTEATKAAHGAIEVIDELVRGLHALRDLLVSEIQADEDARAAKGDAIHAEHPALRKDVTPADSKSLILADRGRVLAWLHYSRDRG